MKYRIHQINALLPILIILFVSCSKRGYQNEKLENNQLTTEKIRVKDMLSNDSVVIYQIQMDTLLYERKYLRLHMYKKLKFINGQDLIGYGYCNSRTECDTTSYEPIINGRSIKYQDDEITGQIREEDSHWMHPPRSEYFRILEMNAFPYFVRSKKEWYYDLNFGEHWGDEKWLTWKGRRTSYSEYRLTSEIVYEFGNLKLKCFEIRASTKIEDLGETESTFYYNETYGFVYMRFKTINGEIIEFKMT